MARFDETFAELQAKLAAAMSVIAQHPEIAAQVHDAVEGVTRDAAAVAEEQAQDDARANALASAIADVRAVLVSVDPRPATEQPAPSVWIEPAPVEVPVVEVPVDPPVDPPVE